MPWYITALLLYLCLINLIAIFVTIRDKRCAKQGRWRVPESTLLLVSALGGSPAMYATMRRIRHKTQKAKFMVGIPVILALQLLLAGLLIYWLH